MKRRWKRAIVLSPLIFLVMLLFIAIGGGVVQLLWNWLLPPLFGVGEISFWQALGLLALCRILFGGFGYRGSRRSRFRRRMAERCEAMTPEERERFRQRMNERWGFAPSTGETKAQSSQLDGAQTMPPGT